MAVYIYTVMIIAQKDGGRFKHKLFEFTNKQSAKQAVKRLAKEITIITGEKPDDLSNENDDDHVHLFYLSDDRKEYFSITCHKSPAATLSNSNADLNFNFKNNED